MLLPASDASFLTVLGAFLAAQLLGLASHVPGGVGVFEGLMVLLLKPFLSSAQLIPALVVYRAVYYLMPLSVALVGLVADEVHQRRTHARRLTAYLGQLAEQVTPQVLAVFTFIAGLVLLFSGSTPAAADRLAVLNRVLPLGIIETSHLIGSVAGASLLLLSQGLARRLDIAYYLTEVTTAAGIVASLLKGGDYEEAAVLALLLLVLRRVRPAFDRQAAFFATRFSPGWVAAVAGALLASVWLGLFAFKHVEYPTICGGSSSSTHTPLARSARRWAWPRSSSCLRVRGCCGTPRTRSRRHPMRICRRRAGPRCDSLATYPYLVYLRDKALLFDQHREAFVMYGMQGRTWVALGNPVGPPGRVPELIRAFIERCDDFGGTPVFYEVGQENLHRTTPTLASRSSSWAKQPG